MKNMDSLLCWSVPWDSDELYCLTIHPSLAQISQSVRYCRNPIYKFISTSGYNAAEVNSVASLGSSMGKCPLLVRFIEIYEHTFGLCIHYRGNVQMTIVNTDFLHA